jgi:hypothetical protein
MLNNNQTCGNCLYWQPKETRLIGKIVGKCAKMRDCFCCHQKEKEQIAGAVGGGDFESFSNFGCILWRVDSRNHVK